MNFLNSRYCKLNKLCLSLFGLWPHQRPSVRRFTIFLAILGTGNYFFFQATYIVTHINDLDSLIGCFPTFVGSIVLISKVTTLLYNFGTLKEILDGIKDDWIKLEQDKEELEILKTQAERARSFIVTYITVTYAPILACMLLPLRIPILDAILPLNQSRPHGHVYPTEYLIDPEKFYYVSLMGEFFGYLTCITMVVGSDSTYVLAVEHVCSLLAVLCRRLENIMVSDMNEKSAVGSTLYLSLMEENVCRRAVECIKLHIETKARIDTIKTTFSTFLLVDLALGFVLHSTACVMIVFRMDQPTEISRFAALVCTQSLRLFFNSFPGQRLMDYSVAVSSAAYNSAWNEAPVKARKYLLFLMMKSQRPYKITVGGIYITGFDSFGMIIRTSISYCTVMASLHDSTSSS